jgi:hypothetical protein
VTAEPFPNRDPDGDQPDDPAAHPAGNNPAIGPAADPDDDWDADAALDALVAAVDEGRYEPPPDCPAPGGGQGLFVCLPAEQLDVAGFAQHGFADAMAPGPLLAAVADAMAGPGGTGLGVLSDDQLAGVIAATQRLESRIAWLQLAAVAVFAARHPAAAGRAASGPGRGEFAADELAAELHLS